MANVIIVQIESVLCGSVQSDWESGYNGIEE